MLKTLRNLFDKFFRDAKGNIVIWRNPNVPLWGWIIFTVLALLVKHGRTHTGFHLLAQASLITWAYLEVRSGESIFRRVLGAVVLIGTATSFFQ